MAVQALALLSLLTFLSPATALIGSFYQYEGLSYSTLSGLAGTTDANGTFEYIEGDVITFSLGNLILGNTSAMNLLTSANLVPAVNGNASLIHDNIKVTNMAAFLLSLDNDTTTDNNVYIGPPVISIVNEHLSSINFDLNYTDFANSTAPLFTQLNKTLYSVAAGRNYLRRSMLGIKRYRDVKIPIKDNTTPWVLGDIYTPIADSKFPALVNLGSYGKAMPIGCLCNQSQADDQDVYEDSYFYKMPTTFFDQITQHFLPVLRVPEFKETSNTHDWVTRGYVKILIDGPGVCNTPGVFNQFSLEESQAFRDAIEWTAEQPFSNGNVGIHGVSYWSVTGMSAAALKPKGLKAMIPMFTDYSSYRDYVFNGGLYNRFNGAGADQCLSSSEQSIINFSLNSGSMPFYTDKVFGPQGNQTISPDIKNIDVPMWVMAPIEHPGLHTRGSNEAFINAEVPYKKFSFVQGDIFGYPFEPESIQQQIAFMDYYLKDTNNKTAISGPVAEVKIRTGDGAWQWAYFDSWPPKETDYKRLYLSGTPSTSMPVDSKGKTLYGLSLGNTTINQTANLTYSAAVNATEDCNVSGVAFVTDPVTANITLAGYMQLVTYVSSSTDSDMDLVVSVNVLAPNGTAKNFIIYTGFGETPPGYGWLKVSHRKLDPKSTTPYRPYESHLEVDYEPLVKDQVAQVIVEIWPSTSQVQVGDRIRLDVQPQDMCNSPSFHLWNTTYHTPSSLNTVWMGSDYPSYLQIPSIPDTDLSDVSLVRQTMSNSASIKGRAEGFMGMVSAAGLALLAMWLSVGIFA